MSQSTLLKIKRLLMILAERVSYQPNKTELYRELETNREQGLKYVFEVGGRKKGFIQIKDLPDSYVAADDLEIGFGNKIPLWMFGMLY